mmetsp:Transcript_3605/g.8229  ORF Transcript_3605/g.8229 Transcript_3605/m.8229 type:complete len:230 (-) Transcript_3605:394-1083(-)
MQVDLKVSILLHSCKDNDSPTNWFLTFLIPTSPTPIIHSVNSGLENVVAGIVNTNPIVRLWSAIFKDDRNGFTVSTFSCVRACITGLVGKYRNGCIHSVWAQGSIPKVIVIGQAQVFIPSINSKGIIDTNQHLSCTTGSSTFDTNNSTLFDQRCRARGPDNHQNQNDNQLRTETSPEYFLGSLMFFSIFLLGNYFFGSLLLMMILVLVLVLVLILMLLVTPFQIITVII